MMSGLQLEAWALPALVELEAEESVLLAVRERDSDMSQRLHYW